MSITNDLLSREADHRIANSLQILIGFLRTQARASRHPDAAAGLMTASHRVSSIARIHGQLHQDRQDGVVRLGPYLHDLCADLANLGDGGKAMEFTSDDVEIDAGRARDIGIVVTELVLNAFKHGGTVVKVEGRVVGCQLSITVSDDGPGLQSDSGHEKSCGGLGLRLVRRLADGLDTELASIPSERGTTLRLVISLTLLRRPAAA